MSFFYSETEAETKVGAETEAEPAPITSMLTPTSPVIISEETNMDSDNVHNTITLSPPSGYSQGLTLSEVFASAMWNCLCEIPAVESNGQCSNCRLENRTLMTIATDATNKVMCQHFTNLPTKDGLKIKTGRFQLFKNQCGECAKIIETTPLRRRFPLAPETLTPDIWGEILTTLGKKILEGKIGMKEEDMVALNYWAKVTAEERVHKWIKEQTRAVLKRCCKV